MADIPDSLRSTMLIWSKRHCGFCGKPCTTNVEIHHIDGDHTNNDPDNLIPVCFDCHGELPRYSERHPKGTKYRESEIRARRDQIYEMHTREYLRHVSFWVSKYIDPRRTPARAPEARNFGDTSVSVQSHSADLPVRVRTRVSAFRGDQPLKLEAPEHSLYHGGDLWNLNPMQRVMGHLRLPITPRDDPFLFRLEFHWEIVDVVDREHPMLPFSFVWSDPNGDWWYDPRVLHTK